jgi:hypothetical protein
MLKYAHMLEHTFESKIGQFSMIQNKSSGPHFATTKTAKPVFCDKMFSDNRSWFPSPWFKHITRSRCLP